MARYGLLKEVRRAPSFRLRSDGAESGVNGAIRPSSDLGPPTRDDHYFCFIAAEDAGAGYWGSVNKKLAKIRDKHTGATTQSRFIKQKILDPDLQLYGHVTLPTLAAAAVAPVAGPSESRVSTRRAASTASSEG
ncbi:hypothetical protein C8F04DRAFT_1272027 [Mycena alexandri]|uniref:Uncharacterized protein n=1 Tax=Mycena alexandri TaxID=1745969 RepID=A0AAD6SCE3_9AGAR|nr:hypothetical protein C8F04DRAFT_1272027 [Mycena alexandri]